MELREQRPLPPGPHLGGRCLFSIFLHNSSKNPIPLGCHAKHWKAAGQLFSHTQNVDASWFSDPFRGPEGAPGNAPWAVRVPDQSPHRGSPGTPPTPEGEAGHLHTIPRGLLREGASSDILCGSQALSSPSIRAAPLPGLSSLS